MNQPKNELQQMMHSIIQRVATGPELSKSITQDEARLGLKGILEGQINPVQAGIFLIALRMKRETMDENKGILQAILDSAVRVIADVDEVVDIADPYDGYNRTLPASPFLAPLLAELGVAVVSHGLDAVGPKYGVTHRHVLEAVGVDVNLSTADAAKRLTDIGWCYVDQAQYNKPLHDFIPTRTLMVKRSVLTTVEVLCKPISGRQKTYFVTGYVHKPYPPVYAELARHAGFESALLIRGVEGGVIPSLRQAGKYFSYDDGGEEQGFDLNPADLGIQQPLRAPAIPDNLPASKAVDEINLPFDVKAVAKAAADAGMAALNGEKGATYDSLVYCGSLILKQVGKADSLAQAADQIRAVLNSKKAADRVQ